jgi:outer membrane protein assembly factor BamB
MMNKDPTSTCAITPDGSVIYLGFKNDLYAITSGGGLSWTYGTGAWVRSSPAIGSDGTIYVGSDDDYLHAVTSGGTGKWTYLTGGDVRSSPALGSDGTIYVGSDDWALHAIDPTGSVKWSYATGSFVRSSPAVGSDGTIYVGSNDTYLYAINPDGSLKWQHKTDGAVFSSPTIDDGRGVVYVGCIDSCLRAINTVDGSEKWKTDLDATIEYCSPAVAEPNNMIYTGAGSDFHVIDGSDGQVVCTNSHPYGITSPAIDNPATNGGNWCVWYNIWSAGIVKVCCPPIGVENESSRTELRLELFIHPNFAGSNTSISFGIPTGTHVLLEVYDVTGRLVQELAKGTRSAGEHTVEWNAADLADGVYFCKLTTKTGILSRKLVLIK